MQIRLPAAGTTAIGTMLIGDFLVDGSESGRGKAHHRHGRKLGGTEDVAEGYHDGPMHLCAGRFAVRNWLHDYSASSSLFAPWRTAAEATMPGNANSALNAEHRYALM
jgi:hypothetical protein